MPPDTLLTGLAVESFLTVKASMNAGYPPPPPTGRGLSQSYYKSLDLQKELVVDILPSNQHEDNDNNLFVSLCCKLIVSCHMKLPILQPHRRVVLTSVLTKQHAIIVLPRPPVFMLSWRSRKMDHFYHG